VHGLYERLIDKRSIKGSTATRFNEVEPDVLSLVKLYDFLAARPQGPQRGAGFVQRLARNGQAPPDKSLIRATMRYAHTRLG